MFLQMVPGHLTCQGFETLFFKSKYSQWFPKRLLILPFSCIDFLHTFLLYSPLSLLCFPFPPLPLLQILWLKIWGKSVCLILHFRSFRKALVIFNKTKSAFLGTYQQAFWGLGSSYTSSLGLGRLPEGTPWCPHKDVIWAISLPVPLSYITGTSTPQDSRMVKGFGVWKMWALP